MQAILTATTIDLGTRVRRGKFTQMLSTVAWNSQSFKYPKGRLLGLNGTIPDDETFRPTALDQDAEQCLVMIKRGNTTGLTIGRASNICSFARLSCDSDVGPTSKEWAILSFDSESGSFSAKGDSGSVIVDGQGRIGGLLTSGAGAMDTIDIMYATPVDFLLERWRQTGSRGPTSSQKTDSRNYFPTHLSPIVST